MIQHCCLVIRQVIELHVVTVVILVTKIIWSGQINFFPVINNRYSLCSNLKRCSNLHLGCIISNTIQETILVMTAQELSHGKAVG